MSALSPSVAGDFLNAFEYQDYLVFLAGGIFCLGYLIINQVFLRIMGLIGMGLYILYYAIAAETPLWSAIWVSVAMVITNLIGLFSLWLRSSPLSIPRRYRDIYAHFDILPPGDFRKLMRAARRGERPMGYELTQVGNPVDTLTFVIDGGADVLKSGQTFSLPDGIFVGEIAYLTGHAASATVVLTGKSDVLEWNIPALRRQAARDVQFRLALDAMISLDLAGKVARGGSPVQV